MAQVGRILGIVGTVILALGLLVAVIQVVMGFGAARTSG